jgi:hypothetical protein
MITINNYHDIVKSVNFASLPEALRKGHEFVRKVTNNGASWDNYNSSTTIKKTVDTYFEKLDEFVDKDKKVTAKSVAQKKQQQSDHEVIEEAKRRQGIKPAHKSKQGQAHVQKNTPHLVERIPDEVRFIKRFVHFDGKTKTKEELLRFINSLQKAILEKKIRKTSVYAEEIRYIQRKLIDTYNSMGAKIALELKPETVEKLQYIAVSEKIMPAVSFIKRYINLNGKTGVKDKAKVLLGQINRAVEKGQITDSDPYIVEIHDIKKHLEQLLSDKNVKVLQIEQNSLNGLSGIVNGCGCQHLSGIGDADTESDPVIMNSMDFADMRFRTLGFKGKWLQLIGDPSTNFTVMVFGKPKMGKSYLCVDLAGYLARNHGKVLYVAREEGLDKTLQDKLNDKDVKHPNLYMASTLPASLAPYDFVFFDSVNKLGLTPEDLNRLKAMYPDKSFVYIFQTTKDGKFRGANTFQHDVDSVVEVPERGKAVQYGRFNQGGEIQIF